MIIAAVVAGYLTGGLPTADWVARARGVDLRTTGSGNPGANNARRVGGVALGLVVLVLEVAKGFAVVSLAATISASIAVVVAVAAAAGNVVNPFRRFSGGQGLGITLGLLLAAWPTVVPIVLAVIGTIAIALRQTPIAAVSAAGVLIGSAVVWNVQDLPTAWGLPPDQLPALAVGLAVVLLPKQIRNLLSA